MFAPLFCQYNSRIDGCKNGDGVGIFLLDALEQPPVAVHFLDKRKRLAPAVELSVAA